MFIPEISHIEEIMGIPMFVTVEGVIGAAFKVPVVDLESLELSVKLTAFEQLISGLSSELILRVRSSSFAHTQLPFKNERQSLVQKLGFLDREVLLFFETSSKSVFSIFKKKQSDAQILYSLLPHEDLKALSANSLTQEEITQHFSLPNSDIERNKASLDFGKSVIGVIRLYKPGVLTLSEESLATLLQGVPMPFTISVTLKKTPRHVTEFALRSKLARQSVSNDPTSDARLERTKAALEETSLDGVAQVRMEWLLVIERTSEELLRNDLAKALSILRPMGDLMIETFGCAPSFKATLLGSAQHFTFTEYDKSCVVFLPVFTFGESLEQERIPTERALLLHREDGSLHFFDQFSDRFLAYNVLISGKTGSGKSVLANALSSALLSDPNVLMVKVDVGGSYSKECKIYGGIETSFSLDKPSGVNPFQLLSDLPNSNDAIDILTKLLATLVREEGEVTIPRSLVVEIGKALKNFAASNTRDFSIDSFYLESESFPRKELLSRWCNGGVFENALRAGEQSDSFNSRYRYYNFESIQSAGNSDYAEGVMAAVIAQVNLEMLRLGRATHDSKRLVLFCDETKFFIEKNASFFLLTTANFRKFGHGVILITKKIQNFELQSATGKPDTGIVLNSPTRFFLEQDIEGEFLKDAFRLSDFHLDRIVNHPYRGKEYREFILQDDLGTRSVRLYLTSEEYWRVTSTKEDNDKITKLQKAVPSLTLQEAIRCVSLHA